MATIAFDSSAQGTTGGATLTFSHTCTGSNLKLFVSVTDGSGAPATSVTYNGVSMIKVATDQRSVNLWYLDNPATGAHNVVVNGNGPLSACSSSFTGCGSGIDNSNVSSPSSTNVVSNAVTPIATNCWIVFAAGIGAGQAISSNNGNTDVRQNANTLGASDIIADTNGTASGSTTMSVKTTGGSTQNWGSIAASFAPFVQIRTASITMMNASSRLLTVSRLAKFTRSVSLSMMNAVSRLLTLFGRGLFDAPTITIRQNVAPYGILSSLNYYTLSPAGTQIPVLDSTDSEPMYFRIYNNYGLVNNIADVVNVMVTTWDGVGHSASMPVASHQWLHVLQNGWGEGSMALAWSYTRYMGSTAVVGGSTMFSFDYASNGSPGLSEIRAGSNHNGSGFLEAKTYINPRAGEPASSQNFVISVIYQWSP
jgi:hypothetical protein